jgi:hypothetical protein
MRHRPGTLCSTSITYGPLSIACDRPADHEGAHAGHAVAWTDTAAARPAASWVDDAPTAKLPPITDTIRRRPPVPDVRELKGAELLEALAAAIRADEDLAAGDPDHPGSPCMAAPATTGGRLCGWPVATPCLAYGVEGCGMKAQES